MTYYTDESRPFTLDNSGGMNATSSPAASDAGCTDASSRNSVFAGLNSVIDNGDLTELICSPNPGNEIINFTFSIPRGKTGLLNVTDPLGRQMAKTIISDSDHLRTIDIIQWHAG